MSHKVEGIRDGRNLRIKYYIDEQPVCNFLYNPENYKNDQHAVNVCLGEIIEGAEKIGIPLKASQVGAIRPRITALIFENEVRDPGSYYADINNGEGEQEESDGFEFQPAQAEPVHGSAPEISEPEEVYEDPQPEESLDEDNLYEQAETGKWKFRTESNKSETISIELTPQEKVSSLYKFIKELNLIRQKTVMNVNGFAWSKAIRDIPKDDENIALFYRDKVEEEDTDVSSSLLVVHKPEFEACPAPDKIFADWVKGDWQNFRETVTFVKEKYLDKFGFEVTGEELIELKSKIENTFYGIESVEGGYSLEKFEDNEEREKAYKIWNSVRNQWIERQKILDATRKLFSELHRQYIELERESESLEIIIANGFIKDRENPDINQAILTRRVALKYDAKENIIFIEDTDVESDLYSVLLQSMPDLNKDHLSNLRDELTRNDYHPLDRHDTPDYLKMMIHYFSADSLFSEDGEPEGWEREHRFLMYLNPTYIVRKRSDGTLKAIDKILETIDNTGEIPQPIKEIVSGGTVEPPEDFGEQSLEEQLACVGGESADVLLSKEANKEQLIIAQRIEKYNAVLVQGPPGTGKTHTIANLLGHFLAQGKSVLVTSHTKKALSVLKGQVAPGIQNLCVSVLDDSNKDMEKAIDGISEYMTAYNSHMLSREMQRKQMEREQIIKDLAEVRKRLFQMINTETKNIVIDGEDISPSAAARFVLDNAKDLDYIPGKVNYPHGLPLSFDDLSSLYRSNDVVDEKSESELAMDLPDPDELISPAAFSEICESISAKKAAIEKIADENGWKIYNHIAERTVTFKINEKKQVKVAYPETSDLDALVKYLDDFKIIDEWMISAAVDGKKGKAYKQRWITLVDTIKDSCSFAEGLVGSTFGKRVELSTEFNVLDYQNEFVEIRNSGGTISKLQRKIKKRYDEALRSISIDGHEPSNVEECNIAVQYIQLTNLREKCSNYWQDLLGEFDVPAFYELNSRNPEEVASNWIKQIERYSYWYENEYGKLKELLTACNINPNSIFPVDNLDSETDRIKNILKTVGSELRPICEALYSAVNISGYGDTLDNNREILLAGRRESSVLCSNLLQAFDAFDSDDYYDAFNELDKVYNKQDLQDKRETLLNTLQSYAPQWAEAIRNREGIHGKPVVPENIEDAWRWKQYSLILADIAKEPYEQLQEKSIRLSKEYRQVTAKYAEYSAWYHLIKRTEADITLKQDLIGWKQTVRRIGRGTGRQAPRLREDARKLMTRCQTAVPAWIMPIGKALESFDPSKNKFDIIIVDEASQSDISSLAILFMGKKLIIVGDDKQVSPMAIGQEIDKIEALQKEYIRNKIPNGHLYDGKSSIYDVALTTFQPLMLKEHFRCVPEIIGFSNMLSYEHKILPLRDAGSSNLLPAVVNYRVADGKRSGGSKVNDKEALTVVMLLKACLEQPEYAGKTFGVISMLGEEQAKRIQKYLLAYIEPQEIENRKIISGISANFQGDERDVIFLSLVDSGQETGPLSMMGFGTGDAYRKRYNVAASRAKDQLWVVHSLDSGNDLKPGDLRKQLIDYAANPNALEHRYGEIEEHADSPFEIGVAQALVDRGYHIVQQWPVGAYRLDIVAVCGEKKVAIECDGERYHSGEDKIREDMERQAILERIGWRFIRIRGSEYFRDPDKTMNRVFTELNSMDVYPEAATSEENVDRSSPLLEKVKIRASELLEPAMKDLENGVDIDTIAAALSEVATKLYDPNKIASEKKVKPVATEPKRPRGRPPINRPDPQPVEKEVKQLSMDDIKTEPANERVREMVDRFSSMLNGADDNPGEPVFPKNEETGKEQSVKDKLQNLLDGYK